MFTELEIQPASAGDGAQIVFCQRQRNLGLSGCNTQQDDERSVAPLTMGQPRVNPGTKGGRKLVAGVDRNHQHVGDSRGGNRFLKGRRAAQFLKAPGGDGNGVRPGQIRHTIPQIPDPSPARDVLVDAGNFQARRRRNDR